MPGPGPPITMMLAEWAANTRLPDIPHGVRHQVRRGVVDYLTATLLGTTSPSARIVTEYLAEF